MDPRNQSVSVAMEVHPTVQRQGVPKGQFLNIRRQHFRLRHLRRVDEKRNNWNSTLQCISDLQTNEVSWIVDPARSVRLFSKPMRANYRDYQFGSFNHLLYVLAEIRSWR